MQFLPGGVGVGGDIDHSFRQICNVSSPLPLVSFLPVTERGVQKIVAADIRTSLAAVLEPDLLLTYDVALCLSTSRKKKNTG